MEEFENTVKDLIAHINHHYYKQIQEKYKTLKLPYLQLRILIYLLKQSATVSEIANDLRIAKSNVSFLLKNLEKENYVTRNRQTNDERVVMIELTEKSRILFNGISTQEVTILNDTSIEDQEVILKGLYTLKALLGGSK